MTRKSQWTALQSGVGDNRNKIITTELVARTDFFHHLPWSTKRESFVKDKRNSEKWLVSANSTKSLVRNRGHGTAGLLKVLVCSRKKPKIALTGSWVVFSEKEMVWPSAFIFQYFRIPKLQWGMAEHITISTACYYKSKANTSCIFVRVQKAFHSYQVWPSPSEKNLISQVHSWFVTLFSQASPDLWDRPSLPGCTTLFLPPHSYKHQLLHCFLNAADSNPASFPVVTLHNSLQ